jgi:hypothetical protein
VINSQATAERAPTPGNNHAEITVRDCRASVLDINFPQFDRLPPPAVRLMGLFFVFFFSLRWLLSSFGFYQCPTKMTEKSFDKRTLAKTGQFFILIFYSSY